MQPGDGVPPRTAAIVVVVADRCCRLKGARYGRDAWTVSRARHHRDLKSDTVFLVPDPDVPGGERIKLLDFGIAKLAVASSTTPCVTRTGAVIGTPTYMAPEQCRGVAVDHRADLYALGCVIYEL